MKTANERKEELLQYLEDVVAGKIERDTGRIVAQLSREVTRISKLQLTSAMQQGRAHLLNEELNLDD